jgi:hypothetical protein
VVVVAALAVVVAFFVVFFGKCSLSADLGTQYLFA